MHDITPTIHVSGRKKCYQITVMENMESKHRSVMGYSVVFDDLSNYRFFIHRHFYSDGVSVVENKSSWVLTEYTTGKTVAKRGSTIKETVIGAYDYLMFNYKSILGIRDRLDSLVAASVEHHGVANK